MKPNPNLWAVDFAIGATHDSLWICAATVTTAENKARRYLKKMGYRGVRIVNVASKGTIDVF